MKYLFTLITLLLSVGQLLAQRQMENLDRGLVAVKVNQGVYTSWRISGQEYYGTKYNLYRDGSLIAGNLEVSNYLDASGTSNSTYSVAPVTGAGVGEKGATVSVWNDQYLEIPLQPVINPKTGRDVTSVMSITDGTVADLDGDGQYELVIERQNTDVTLSNDSAYTRFEAYEFDGTKLWEVNLGPNMRDGNGSENACYAFDFDEDGKAEIIFRGGDGTILPDGTILGNKTVNYRNGSSSTQTFMEQGDEFIVMLDGATGATLDYQIFDSNDDGYNPTTNNKTCPKGVYEPGTNAPGNNLARRSVAFWGKDGDGGHRATKFYFGAPYLDGIHPYVYIGRGAYTNFHAATWRVVNKKLQLYWACAVDDTSSEYYGQGYHNFSVVDVDLDGRDELCQGNMVVDEYGHFHSTTGLGHGDAQHYGDLDPFRDGMEGFRCLEENPGAVFVDANTSEVLFRWKRGSDCGRCMAGNFTDNFAGAQLWTVDGNLWSASTTRDPQDRVATSAPGITMNARIYWDGDLLEESFDYTSVSNYQGYDVNIYKYGSSNPIFQTKGCLTINSTKGNPCVQADIFGDWREELVLPTTDNKKVRIYTTTDVTTHRIYTLMHDPQYRQAVYWQSSGYNQPPHTSFFLGNLEGILLPPPSPANNGKTKVGYSLTSASDGTWLVAEKTIDTEVAVNGTVSPAYLQVNSPANYTLTGGTFSGATTLLKQGQGTLTLTGGTYQQSGNTEVWYGTLNIDVASYTQSPVLLKRFARLHTSASLGSLSMEYGSTFCPGGENRICEQAVALQTLSMDGGAILEFDMLNDGTSYDAIIVDSLHLAGANCIGATPTFCLRRESGKLAAGDYPLIHVNKSVDGDVSKICVKGLSGLKYEVKQVGKDIVLSVVDMRMPGDIVLSESGTWDLDKSESFMLDGQPVTFVTGDKVTIDATHAAITINVAEDVEPASLTVMGNRNVTINGSGKIGGSCQLVKKGAGTLIINNLNTFTGGVRLEEGKLQPKNYADAQNDGSLGAYQEGAMPIYIDNGATLVLRTVGIFAANVTVADSAIISTAANVSIDGTLSGGGLVKQGASTLTVLNDPTLRRALLQEGTWSLDYCSGKNHMADTIVFCGGTLAFTSASLYQSCNNVWIVPAGQTGSVSPSNTLACNSMLLGEGTFNYKWHNSSTPREYLEGDWSGFGGTINFTGLSLDHPIRLCNLKGLPKAKVVLTDANTAISVGGDPDSKKSHGAVTGVFRIGELTGKGTLAEGYASSSSFEVGALNTNFTFAGSSNAPLNKVGSGQITFTSNTGNGAVTIKEGTARVNGGSISSASNYKSASGTGSFVLESGTSLMATGCMGNSALTVKSGATFQPGYYYTGNLGIRGYPAFKEGSVIEFRLSKNQTCNSFTGYNNFENKGNIRVIQNSNYTPAAGDRFSLWETKAYGTTNAPVVELFDLPDSLMWDTDSLNTRLGIIKVVVNPEYVNGITEISADEDGDSSHEKIYYNLLGQPVCDLKRGQVYLSNGRKIVW